MNRLKIIIPFHYARMPRYGLLAAACLLTACASTPLIIDSSHPASADARPSQAQSFRNPLGPDATTQRTQSLLAQREKEARAAEAERPANPSPSPAQ